MISQTAATAWSDSRLPGQAVVNDLVCGFRDHFPTLHAIAPTRAWGGWIGMTPSNMAVAGTASPRIYYSMACNGHGLPQAPYLGSLVADHLAGDDLHDDLRAVWRRVSRFAPRHRQPGDHPARLARRPDERAHRPAQGLTPGW